MEDLVLCIECGWRGCEFEVYEIYEGPHCELICPKCHSPSIKFI